MSTVRDLLRRWLGVADGAQPGAAPRGPGSKSMSRALHALNRQVAQLRGLQAHQADLTVEALRRAGWEAEEDVLQHAALQRALRAVQRRGDVVAGPWTGEVGFELLYWIPFLNWLVEQGLDPQRLVIVSRGGAAPWYRHLTSRYVDLLDLMTPDEFRRRTEGKKKQYDERRDFDKDIVEQVRTRLSLPDGPVVHPSAMFRLFASLWRKRATVDLVESFTSHRALTPPDDAGDSRPSGLPAGYLAAKFYFSKAFPDTTANRNFVADLLRRVSRQVPVALLSTPLRLDEHRDFHTAGGSGLYVIDAHEVPQKNLERQTRLICGAHGFIGTYGGFSYLAPFHGIRSVSFFSRRGGFESHHLELADRVFDRLLPGGFLAIDRRAGDLVEPAVARWAAGTATPTDRGTGAAATEGARVDVLT